jgi:hypothetical protein
VSKARNNRQNFPQQTAPNVVSSRRSSNESIIRSGSRQSTSSQVPTKIKVPTQVSDMLKCALDWDFEIFRLEELTDKHPLVYLGMELFQRFDVFNTFNCDEGTFRSWLMVIESHYHSVNTYHNSSHAADVMQVRLRSISRKMSDGFSSIFIFSSAGHGVLPAATRQSRLKNHGSSRRGHSAHSISCPRHRPPGSFVRFSMQL